MNGDKIVACDVVRYDLRKNIFVADKKFVSVEKCFEIRVNGQPFRKIFCSPENIEDLAVGILAQAGKIPAAENISCSEVKFSAKNILNCADKLLGELSTTHGKTNGVHSGILFDGEKILLHREDIGRHNVFDKIFGAAIRQKIFLGDKMIIFSGRCSCEMILKIFRMKIPVVVAKSVPTTQAINFAKNFGVTLAGRLTADSFCIYSNPERIVLS
ncbi:MAG: formate dehydrogenase accessory sulfurtransferase FdhD [Selenomonadaceae bacterium]|nr:formate dehydrogenase accessory sulfurtransferase FdhD [Selenomonadaceae bacterium]